MIASPRQRSFTNSVPEALEDGILKKQVLGGQEFYECVVCRSSMAGIVPAKSHLEGSRHIKAIQRDSYSVGLVSSFNNLDLSSNNLDYNRPLEYQIEPASNPEDFDELLLAMKRSIVSENVVCGKQFYKCNVCNISCTGAACIKEHLQGEQHRKKLKREEVVEEERNTFKYNNGVKDEDLVEERMIHGALQYFCKLCNIACTGKENLNQHLGGKQHMKTKKNKLGSAWSTLDPSSSKESPTPLKERNIQPRNSPANVEGMRSRTDSKPDVASLEMILKTASGHYCLICDTLCSDEAALQQHLQGSLHYQKYQEQKSLQEEMITPAPSSSHGYGEQSSLKQMITPSSSSSTYLRRSASPGKSLISTSPSVAYNIVPSTPSDLGDIKIYLANEPLDNLFSE